MCLASRPADGSRRGPLCRSAGWRNRPRPALRPAASARRAAERRDGSCGHRAYRKACRRELPRTGPCLPRTSAAASKCRPRSLWELRCGLPQGPGNRAPSPGTRRTKGAKAQLPYAAHWIAWGVEPFTVRRGEIVGCPRHPAVAPNGTICRTRPISTSRSACAPQ